MKNLKITLTLSTPAVLSRLTTIDSILLSLYYSFLEKNGKTLDFDPEHKTVNFLERKNGVFSGSIWYLSEDSKILYDFNQRIKNTETQKAKTYSKGGNFNLGFWKNALIKEETIFSDKIHFYIRGNYDVIEKLLSTQLKYIGGSRKLGFGKVSSFKIEIIDEDKGYMLNNSTPSKPLAVDSFSVNTKKVALFRATAPYWLEENKVPCYMPSLLLQESEDKTVSTKGYLVDTSLEADRYNAVLFTKAVIEDLNSNKQKNIVIEEVPVKDLNGKTYKYIDDNNSYTCAMTGRVEKCGVLGDLSSFLRDKRKSFADFNYVKNNEFLSHSALWALQNIKTLGNIYLDEDNLFYLQGKNKAEGTTAKEMIPHPEKLKPPFLASLKDTDNSQHINFKSKVSISNAFFFLQYGNETLCVDSEALVLAQKHLSKLFAIAEAAKVKKNEKYLVRQAALGDMRNESHYFHPSIEFMMDDIMEYKRVFDYNTRKIMALFVELEH